MMLKTFAIACLSIVMLASGAFAQTTPPVPSPNQGVFDQLSPGNQNIAQALFDAGAAGQEPRADAPRLRPQAQIEAGGGDLRHAERGRSRAHAERAPEQCLDFAVDQELPG